MAWTCLFARSGEGNDGPDDAERGRRLEWAKRMKRADAQDVQVCPRCSGPMAMIAFIEDARVAQRILAHLGMPTRASPGGVRAPAAQPPRDEAANGLDGTDPTIDND